MKLGMFVSGFFTLCTLTLFAQTSMVYTSSGDAIEAGIKAHDEENYADAITEFEKVFEGDTNYLVAQFELANTLFAMEEYQESKKLCEIGILENNSTAHNFYVLLGTIYDKIEEPENSIETYSKGIEKFPTNYSLYYNRAVTYLNMEKHQECIEDLKNTLKYNPFHASSHLQLAKYAQAEGEISKAMMCYNAYFMLSPANNTAVLGAYNDYLNESYDPVSKDVTLSDENFEDIDEMIASMATKSKKYKTPNKLSLPVVKQNHLLFTELQKRKLTDGFWDTYYVPFCQRLMTDGKFNDLMYYNLRTATNKSVVSVLEKNIKSIQTFPDYAGKTWQSSASDRMEMFDGKNQRIHYYWSGSSTVEGRGVVIDSEPTSKFEYYYSTGKLNAIGHYDMDGERDGDWIYYHRNGIVSGIEKYEDGDIVGTDTSFHDNGEIKSITTYKNGKADGVESNFYSTGIISNQLTYSEGQVSGPAKYYSEIGTLTYSFSYVDDEITGKFTEFHDNGQVAETATFESGNRVGEAIKYHRNGQKQSEANYEVGALQGTLTSWYSDGSLKTEAEYLDGTLINSRKQYFRNGQLETEENFDETGKKTGVYKEFDDLGHLNLQLEYKKGDLIAYKVFHQDGSLIKEAKKKGGNFLFENFYSDGTKKAVGSYIPGDKGKDGLWQFYNSNGVMTSKSFHEEGEQTGTETVYFSSGAVYSTTQYENGKPNGAYEEFYSTGQKSEEGYYIDGNREGLWITYRKNGVISNEIFYVKGDLNGPSKYFCVNGKIDLIDYYDMGNSLGFEIFDTNEVLIQKVDYTGDSSMYTPQFPTGDKIRSFTKKGKLYHGPSSTFYISGQKSSEGSFWNNNKQGVWTSYYENGQISNKGSYENDEKNGDWVYFHESGKKSITETYVNGLVHGTRTWYLENGKKDAEKTYEYGTLHGDAKYYDANGVLQHIRKYAYGKFVGYSYLGKDNKPVEMIPVTHETCDCKSYFSNGKESRVFSMDKGNFINDYLEYYENGQLFSKTSYDKGDVKGLVTEYYDNGKVKKEEPYQDNLVEGMVKYYNTDGTLDKTEVYVQGSIHGNVDHYKNGKVVKTELYYDGNKISK